MVLYGSSTISCNEVNDFTQYSDSRVRSWPVLVCIQPHHIVRFFYNLSLLIVCDATLVL